MVKLKGKGRLSEKTCEKVGNGKGSKKVNPFEIVFSKEKHVVIGRRSGSGNSGKVGKGVVAVGKPYESRGKALEKRKKTLLKEYKSKDKKNVVIDKRIGEKDGNLDAEEKMLARFAAERLQKHKKSSIFNLGGGDDDFPLTHFGKSLSEIEQFEDPRSDDDNDDDKKLDAKFVDQVHFGGFMEKADDDFASGRGNTRKEWIDNMISESRKRKVEKQKNMEEAQTMTHDLDSKWKELMPQLRSSKTLYTKKSDKMDDEDDIKNEPYDILMRQLGMEPKKAKATERLKTEEEIINDEREKLEKLEQDRQRRMNGGDTHESIDDLNDDQFDLDNSESDEDDNVEKNEENDDEEDDEEEDDKYSDLDEDDDDDEDEEEEMEVEKSKSWLKKSNKKMTEEASREIPYTFTVPDSYEELLTHFEGRSNQSDIETIVSRIIKCNHPQFGENNKAKLEQFFAFLLQYIYDCSSSYNPSQKNPNRMEKRALEHINVIIPYLYDISKFSPQSSAKSVLNVIQEKYDDYKKQSKRYPGLDTLVFIKITFLLFPTSDYRHPVVTPTLQFISHILSTAKVINRQSVSSGLILSSLFIECLQLSKRFSPELMNYLNGIIYICIYKDKSTIIPIVPPFKVVGNESNLLYHSDILKEMAPNKLKWSDSMSSSIDNDDKEIDAQFCIDCCSIAVRLINELVDLWYNHSASKEIFEKSSSLLQKLSIDNFHSDLQESIRNLIKKIELIPSSKKPIMKQQPKPKMLRLYEPDVEDDFDPFHKKRKGNKDKLEMDKLLHKVKREKKGAKKDIRADAQFLARTKAKEQREKDFERQRKTKEILAGLGSQEGDYRKMLKEKNKKNRK